MSAPGRPSRESFERQREGGPVHPSGRRQGESPSAQREGSPSNAPGGYERESFGRGQVGSPASAPGPIRPDGESLAPPRADPQASAETVLVLMYHRVDAARNAWEARYAISPSRFAEHMAALHAAGWRAATAAALVEWLEGGAALPARSFVLTFDDGFRSVKEHALPVLQRLGWPFTVFLVSGLIGRQDVWTQDANPDRVTYPLLDAAEILDMQRAGVTFHSHTRSHASLPTLDEARLAEELAGSRAELQALLGTPVDLLAYPFGHVDERVALAAKQAGYRAAFSTQPGFNRRDVDRHRIRRLDVYGTDTPAQLLRKMKLGTNDGSVANLARYYWGRARSRLHAAA
jgi:peptidoglycan/xylan/chitin deacetylase (PgdA/CDA1 family)